MDETLTPLVTVWREAIMILAFTTLVLIIRNLRAHYDDWTWQERAFARGTYVLVFTSITGPAGRVALAYDALDPALGVGLIYLSLTTLTIGILFLLYSSIGKPIRFEGHE